MFTEMRTAALLQKVRRSADVLPARQVLRLATAAGAHALGLQTEIGSLEVGKRADITIIDLERLHLTPRPDIVSSIVYAAEAGDVRDVLIDGRLVLRAGKLLSLAAHEVIAEARTQAKLLFERAAI
jgi:5-methylthioadenosine/S-adenosylhomocysteine deaminase